MSDAGTARSKANPWILLIEETRGALAHLRAEDLEELAARAQCMLNATLEEGLIRQCMPRPQLHEMTDLGRQHHLLDGLLHATKANSKVLKHTVGEENSRWVR